MAVVGIDIQDDMGRHEVGFVDNTEKTPIGDNNKGCIFHSTFFINKVPGNFHISTHSSHKQPDDPDFAHVIKEIRLGDKIIASVPGSFNPLAGVSKNTELGKLNILTIEWKYRIGVYADNLKNETANIKVKSLLCVFLYFFQGLSRMITS